MRRARKTPLPGNASLSEWRFPLSECHCPADIAKLVLFLASDGASFMTGDDIDCDGGLMAQGAWA